MAMINLEPNMMRYSILDRRGIHLRRSVDVLKGVLVYEYWARPLTSVIKHKLGDVQKREGQPFKALRGMRSGTQLKDFDSLRDAEEWIAACDTWGQLEASNPKK